MRRVLVIVCLVAAIWPVSLLAIHVYRAVAPDVADGNAPSAVGGAGARLTAVVSVAPHGWLVGELAGRHARVIVAVPPGASPATYQPTDAQVSRIMAADVYFRTGVPFERGPWFRALQRHSDLRIVDLRHGLPRRTIKAHHHDHEARGHDKALEHANEHRHEQTHEHGHAHPARANTDSDPSTRPSGEGDPHIWTSPPLLRIQAATIAGVLGELDPSRRRDYRMNLRRVDARLDRVDRVIRQRLQPHAGRAFFVFHPSWGYFAEAYNLRQVAIEVEGKDPSDRQLTELQALARRKRARVVFVQPQNAGRGAQAVAEAIGGQMHTIDPLAENVPKNLLEVAAAIDTSLR